ncbi:hypothetical protein [Streptomyces sp. NBC_00470]|uniref:hypothetical protein n=1 Tax=Streptomyces sp. NBC_00470 TaxID=2975753 RepID=UPI0030DE1403
MPDDHQPVALDSAQQAGRAWGVLIAADHFVLPDPDALAAVIDRDGISPTAARELRDQAELTGTALQRAHELSPYDGAPESLLVADWRQLAACGPELPDAATAAYEVLEQLAARTVSDDDHAWMDSSHARDTARLVAALAGTDPLLAPLTQLLTSPEQPYPDVRQARLREPDLRHRVMLAATAYARVHSVLTSPTRAGGHPIGDRRTAVEIAAPAVRTLQGFNAALSTLTTDQGAAPAEMELDHSQLRSLVRKFTDLAEAVRSLSHGANATQRSQAGPAEHRPGQHPAQDATTRPRRPAP